MSRPILILSGDTFEIRTLTMSLEVEKFQLLRCSNSEQIWDNLSEGHPRPLALIADLKVPWDDMRGIFRRFRSSERGRNAPIIVLGDDATIQKKDTIESSGVNPTDFFPHPVDAVGLVRRLALIPPGGEDPPSGFHVTNADIRGAVIGSDGLPSQSNVAGAAAQGPSIPPMGSLSRITPARLLCSLNRDQETGRLELQLEDGRSDIFLSQGAVVHLNTRGVSAIGRMVVTGGMATEAQVRKVGDPAQVSLEQLIAAGVLGPHQAFDLLNVQLVRFLKDTAGIRQGDYRWRPGELPAEHAFPLSVRLHRTLLDGLVENPPVPHPMPPRLAQALPTLTPQGKALLGELALNAVESRLVRELDGRTRLWNVVHQLAGGDDERQAHLEALVIGLRDIGVLALRQATERSRDFARGGIPRPRPGEGDSLPPKDPVLEALLAEVERVKGADPFDVLGVTPETSPDDCRKVFFELSKRFHPDKFYGKSEAIREAVEEIFKHLQDSHAVLSHPEKREAFRKMRVAGTERPITEEDEARASILARQASLYLKNRNYAAAQQLLEEASQFDPLNKEHQLNAIWAAHLASPKDVSRNLTRLHALVSKGCDTPDAFYYFGVLLKTSGDVDQAERAFKKALATRPGFLEPQRELRLIEMRRRKAEEEQEASKRTGLFGYKKS